MTCDYSMQVSVELLMSPVGINSNLVMNKLIPTIIKGATAGDKGE